MSGGTRRRQLVLAALAANAVKPPPGGWAGIPGFALGWPTSELAPHLLIAGAADTAAELTERRRRSKPSAIGLVAAAAAAGMLGWTIAGARRVGTELDEALKEGIGEDYLTTLELPGPDLRIPRGSVARPFKFHQHDVERIRNVSYTEGGRKARLDIYRPRDVDLSKAPVLLQIHGGGLDDRHQGAAGAPADEPDGAAGLGLRRVQLPARAEVPVPHPDRRREAGHRLGPREHRGVRRRPVVPRDHRRVGRRPPLAPLPR